MKKCSVTFSNESESKSEIYMLLNIIQLMICIMYT